MIGSSQTNHHKERGKQRVTVDSRFFWWLGVKVFWHLSRWKRDWRADPKVNKCCFLIIVWCSLESAKLSLHKRAELVMTGEEDYNFSCSNLSGFKLLWDYMLSIWVPAVNSESFICSVSF